DNDQVSAVKLNDKKHGEVEIKTPLILSSAGLPETLDLTAKKESHSIKSGSMSFTETIMFMPRRPKDYGLDTTLIFHNNRDKYLYKKPQTLIDDQSAVICLPNNYHNSPEDEG